MARIYEGKIDESYLGVLQFIKPHSRVLEFGPATGYATQYMKEKLFCSVVAIELIPEMAKKVGAYAEKVIVANIDENLWEEALETQEDSFDYIIFADVLEHLRDPRKAIQRGRKFLRPEGCILTSVPNIGHNSIIMNLRNGIFDYTEQGLLDDTHIHFFTRKSLFDMFQESGFSCLSEKNSITRPCQTEYHIHYLSSPWLMFSLLRKKDGHVYQFVNCWQQSTEISTPSIRPHRLSFFGAIREIIIDFLHCIYQCLGKSIQEKIKQTVQSGRKSKQ